MSQNSQEKTCIEVLFPVKWQAQALTFMKKGSAPFVFL